LGGSRGRPPARPAPARRALAATTGSFAPNAFLRAAADNTVTVIAKHLEMGQGSYTGLAIVLAEELDVDWAQIRVESAPANAKLYNLAFGAIRGTGGSTAARIPGQGAPGRGAGGRDAGRGRGGRMERPRGRLASIAGWSITRSRGVKPASVISPASDFCGGQA
jgi:hypothetical protein